MGVDRRLSAASLWAVSSTLHLNSLTFPALQCDVSHLSSLISHFLLQKKYLLLNNNIDTLPLYLPLPYAVLVIIEYCWIVFVWYHRHSVSKTYHWQQLSSKENMKSFLSALLIIISSANAFTANNNYNNNRRIIYHQQQQRILNEENDIKTGPTIISTTTFKTSSTRLQSSASSSSASSSKSEQSKSSSQSQQPPQTFREAEVAGLRLMQDGRHEEALKGE